MEKRLNIAVYDSGEKDKNNLFYYILKYEIMYNSKFTDKVTDITDAVLFNINSGDLQKDIDLIKEKKEVDRLKLPIFTIRPENPYLQRILIEAWRDYDTIPIFYSLDTNSRLENNGVSIGFIIQDYAKRVAYALINEFL